MTTILLGILLGLAFGVVLERIGAASPSCVANMLSLRNLSLAKAILMGIGTASVLMFAGQMIGLVDVGHMSVKAAYAGVFLGGLLLGAGWAVSGFCPGTGVVALGAGRKDALFFVAGGLLGAAAYMVSYPWWKSTGLLDGEKLTLGTVPGAKYDGLTGLPGDVLGIVLGLVLIALAFALPERIAPRPEAVQPAE